MTQPSDPSAPQSTPPASDAGAAPSPHAAAPGQAPGQAAPFQPGAGYPPPGYPPYPPPYPYSPPYNTYAILSLVLAIAVFPPLGIYFGNKAKQQIATTGERGIELANVGVVLGWVFTGFLVLMVLIWCGMVATMFGSFAITAP